MYFCDHDRARYSSEVSKHRRVDASALGPELDDPEEITIDGVVGYLLLDIGIAKVSIEALLRKRRELVELLLNRYHFLDVVLRVNELHVHRGVQQIERYPIHFHFDDWSLRFLYSKHIGDVGIVHQILLEIVKELFLGDEGRKDADCVDVCASEVHSEAVGAEDEDFGHFALQQDAVHLLLFDADLEIPLLDDLLQVRNTLLAQRHDLRRLEHLVLLRHQVLDVEQLLSWHHEMLALLQTHGLLLLIIVPVLILAIVALIGRVVLT